jgi:hypothetical protein
MQISKRIFDLYRMKLYPFDIPGHPLHSALITFGEISGGGFNASGSKALILTFAEGKAHNL